jgi:serine/threonine protein kinase
MSCARSDFPEYLAKAREDSRTQYAAGQVIKDRFEVIRSLGDDAAKGNWNLGLNLVRDTRDPSSRILVHKLLHPAGLRENQYTYNMTEVSVMRQLAGDVSVVETVDSSIPDRQESDTVPWIIMEYCDQGNMRQLLARYLQMRKSLPEAFLWWTFESLAKALRYCHLGISTAGNKRTNWAGAQHNDLHSSNIFLTSPTPGQQSVYPAIKLGDFGEATVIPSDKYPRDKLPDIWYFAKYGKKTANDISALGFVIKGMMKCNPKECILPYSTELMDLCQLCQAPLSERPDAEALVQMIVTHKEKAKESMGFTDEPLLPVEKIG